MYPFSIKGVLARRVGYDLTVTAVKSRILEDLHRESINTREEDDAISFMNRNIMQWSFRKYVPVSSGRFILKADGDTFSIYYDISVKRLLFMAIFITILLAIGIFQAQNISFIVKILIIALVWLWFHGANYMLFRVRNRRFLSRILDPMLARG